MTHQSSFINLADSARPVSRVPEAPSIAQRVEALLEFASSSGTLTTERAWRLAREVEKRLEMAAGFVPPGGWNGLAALLAGTKHLQATKRGFVIGFSTPNVELDDQTLQQELLEAMTRRLVPPATAASIFITLGIHPAWGLRLAWEVQQGHRDESPTDTPPMNEVLPPERLEPLREGVFIFISLVVSTFERLKLEHSYAVDALGALLENAADFARRITEDTIGSEEVMGMKSLVDQNASGQRIARVLGRDLLDEVFIPAGVVRDVGDGRFALIADTFGEIGVDRMTHSNREQWFERFLTSEGRCWAPFVETGR